MKKVRKGLFTAAVLVLAAGMMAACGTSSGGDGGTVSDPMLPATVTNYEINYETMDWVEASTIEYGYENDSIASRTETFEGADPQQSTFEFKDNEGLTQLQQFNNGSKTPAKVYDYDAEGRLDRVYTYNGSSTLEQIYQYGNNDAYFTLVLHEEEIIDPENPKAPVERMEEVDSLEVTTNNGLLVKTVNNGLYANWNEGSEKPWERFNGTYTAEYDSNGILSETEGQFRMGPSGKEYKFDLTFEDGRVTEVVRSRYGYSGEDSEEGEWVEDSKLVFTYTDIPMSPERYAAMINAHILGEGNAYYIFNWY